MAKVGETVAGSTEPIILTLKINGATFDVSDYTVDSLTLELSDGTEIDVQGTLVAVADQVVNEGDVEFTPAAGDFVHRAGTLPLESERHWVRIKLLDADNVPLFFPRGAKDYIDVRKA